MLSGVIPDESELTAGARIEPSKQYGFFTDTTVCIGCKACEVACKEWNNLPADNLGLTGQSYDNTGGAVRRIPGATSPSSKKPDADRLRGDTQRRSKAAG